MDGRVHRAGGAVGFADKTRLTHLSILMIVLVRRLSLLPVAALIVGVLASSLALPSTLGAQQKGRARPSTRRGGSAATGDASRSVYAALAPADRALVLRLLAAEDRRAPTDGDLTLLLNALEHRSPLVRRVAVRGIGRLQRPALVDSIVTLARDPDGGVREEAVNAIGQSLQGMRPVTPGDAKARVKLDGAIEALVGAAEASRDAATLGMSARTLGRLPYADSSLSVEVSRVMLEMAQRPMPQAKGVTRPAGEISPAVAQGVAHGLYALARTRRVTGALPPEVIAWLQGAARFEPAATREGGATVENAARVRRLALLALAASGDTTMEVARRAASDRDEQVRRLALLLLPGVRDTAERRALVSGALGDSSWLVRFEGVRSYRMLGRTASCAPLTAAVGDPAPPVTLAAIDALGGGCADMPRAADTLLSITDSRNPQHATRTRGSAGWQPYAHALVALARIAPSRVAPLVRRDATHPIWQVRMYVARAAMILRETPTLELLARDANGDVREAALAGLSATSGHGADAIFLAALASPDYHVVRQAAEALKASPLGDSVVAAAIAALDRLTKERRENSRDPRVALLERISELGSEKFAAQLEGYASDFDSTVAQNAARILERWLLRRVVATPKPLPPPDDNVGAVWGGEYRLTVRIAGASGGGAFVVRLFPDEAPATVARIVRLARAGYYNALTFHRVEPAFVIQGGSPKATEYVGDGPFMRDEVGVVSHTRGTLGISTRGRDTGDAQLFVNLTDNFRLDHDYTVFGEIVAGRDVAEGVLEGDVIERIDVVRVR